MDCNKPLPTKVIDGIQLFNMGRFFEAHELLESAWRVESAENRYLYQGILQLGVGYYHLMKGNLVGANHLFSRALKLLQQFPPVCQGIDVASLLSQIAEAFVIVGNLSPQNNCSLTLPLQKIEITQVDDE